MSQLIRNSVFIGSTIGLSTGCYFVYAPLGIIVPSALMLCFLAVPYLSQSRADK